MASNPPTPGTPAATHSNITDTLLELAAAHSTGSAPIAGLFIFTVCPKGEFGAAILAALPPLMIRGALAAIRDTLDITEDEMIDKLASTEPPSTSNNTNKKGAPS